MAAKEKQMSTESGGKGETKAKRAFQGFLPQDPLPEHIRTTKEESCPYFESHCSETTIFYLLPIPQ